MIERAGISPSGFFRQRRPPPLASGMALELDAGHQLVIDRFIGADDAGYLYRVWDTEHAVDASLVELMPPWIGVDDRRTLAAPESLPAYAALVRLWRRHLADLPDDSVRFLPRRAGTFIEFFGPLAGQGPAALGGGFVVGIVAPLDPAGAEAPSLTRTRPPPLRRGDRIPAPRAMAGRLAVSAILAEDEEGYGYAAGDPRTGRAVEVVEVMPDWLGVDRRAWISDLDPETAHRYRALVDRRQRTLDRAAADGAAEDAVVLLSYGAEPVWGIPDGTRAGSGTGPLDRMGRQLWQLFQIGVFGAIAFAILSFLWMAGVMVYRLIRFL